MKTNKILATVAVLSLIILMSCSGDPPSTPEQAVYLTAESAPLPHLLPEATLLAVELSGMDRRWHELRAVRPLARFQDMLLQDVGLDSDDLPLLAGDRCVFALVSNSDGRVVVPVMLLSPPNVEQAQAALGSLVNSWTPVRARGALWIGPTKLTPELESVANGDGTSLADAIPLDEISQSLPSGGLVRGWINPTALRQLLEARIDGRLSALGNVVGGLLSAELEAVRWIGFRRELESTRIVTDAVVAYDLSVLPPEVSGILNPGATAPQLPTVLPDNVVVAAAFRPEAAASMAWLRYAARHHATTSLRHLDFWIAEFEERSGRSLKADLFDAIGEHAWLLCWESEHEMKPAWVVVFQSPDARRAEATLLDLLSWAKEHAWARTLGLAVPRVADYELDGATAHAITLRTPIGSLAGPSFAPLDGYLVAGSDGSALQTGVAFVRAGAFAGDGSGHDTARAHASMWARGPAISGFAESALTQYDRNSDHTALVGAVAGLIAGVVSAAARAWYEEEALRIHGEIVLDGSD